MIKYFAKGSVKKVLKGETDFVNREIEILIKKGWAECDKEISEAINSISTGNGVTLAEVKSDTDIADAISKKHSEVHNHDTAYEAKNSNIQAHIGSAHAPSNAQKNSDILKSEIESVLTGEITSHTHAGSGGGTIVFLGDI